MTSHRYCVVIPNYNHTQHIEQVIKTINSYELPTIIVNDGSDDLTKNTLESLTQENQSLQLIHLAQNQGKGGAVMAGMKAAHEQGFSHAIQVDADGQHNLNDLPHFISLSQNNPDAVICGIPDYDTSVPLGRLMPRYITHFWVWIETLSLHIKDSMCGFRVYPLSSTVDLIKTSYLGQRMDFDTEILVKLYWKSNNIINLPTKVTYPQDGSSHFRLVHDNWLITKMHTRLVFGMLWRAPALIARRFTKKQTTKKRSQKNINHPLNKHWSVTQERGSTWGIQLLVWIYRIFGQWLFRIILVPVIAYFSLTGNKARQASNKYLRYVNAFTCNPQKIRWYHSYKHFYHFGIAAIDKIRAWLGDIDSSNVHFHNPNVFQQLRERKVNKGAVFIGSHLGNLELCRALGENDPSLKINALVFTKHALKFQSALEKFNPNAAVNLIQVDTLGADTAILLKQKVDDGEIIIIVGDRTSVSQFGRVHYAPFLGQPAPFSQGPFILASILECSTYLLFCLNHSGRYNIYLEPFSDNLKLARTNKSQQLQSIIERYADRLQYYCLKAPYQWFNFYDFWHKDDEQHIQRDSQKYTEK